ncbi:unnamed protein product [Didymodactylos carnosus]|uniref:GH16 domain-containing protein n=1 Tax=Didymodactylos carnosus TaxID=1234261 RepID=A0A814EX42_9BILA|nr:unnamed protein product [Didymodactylos carnosus]CAF0978024.1 unnamed protein product [Didymodactylos carnosus]CAF3644520.1 unnamed protein product [Didymodactylos carnosus]CAF3750842.1 unnamed protein product [Didymodactylos carnosus]
MMWTLFLFLLVNQVNGHPTDGLAQTLKEEFDSTLNTTLWNYGYPWGTYYNNRANMVPRQVKIIEQKVELKATAERSINVGISNEYGTFDVDFSSGTINTNGKFCYTNGYIELLTRVSSVPSSWSTIFLVAQDQTLPEITVMEVFDNHKRFAYGIHYTSEEGNAQVMGGRSGEYNDNLGSDFHRYGVDFGYDQITWYFDDQIVNSFTIPKELEQVKDMCLVVSLGVGGKSQTRPDPKTYPLTMTIDSVQVWQPKYDGFYKFINVNSNLLLEIDGASHDNSARVLQWHDNGGAWQIWHVQYAGNGQYRLIVSHSRQALDAFDWGQDDGTNLIQFPYHVGNNQLWKVHENDDGTITLINVHANKVAGLAGASTNPGDQVSLWTSNGQPDQKWKMVQV